MKRTIKLGYMASGSGSSVEALHEKIQDGRLEGFESSVVLCNKPHGSAKIWERNLNGVPITYSPDAEYQSLTFEGYEVDLVLGLGYINKVGDPVLETYKDRVLNIHPTLLPRHGGKGMYGLATHKAVLAAGDTHTGPTVHLMNQEYDGGRVLRQVSIPVPTDLIGKPSEENAKALQKIVLEEEYQIMTEVLERIRDGKLEIGAF